jgi:hypothetical protein
MALQEISSLNKILMKGLISTLKSEIYNLTKSTEGNEQSKQLISRLWNLKDILELQIYDYYIPTDYTIERLRKILVAFGDSQGRGKKDEKDKELDPILIAVNGLIQILNLRHEVGNTNDKEKEANGNLFIEHFRSHVLQKTTNYSYKGEHSRQSSFIKTTYSTENSEKKTIEEVSTKLSKNKNTEAEAVARVVLAVLQASGDTFKNIQIRVTDSYINLYSNNDSFKFNMFIDNNGKITVKEGTLYVESPVTVVASGGAKPQEDTAPVTAKPTQIEQPKPAAPAKTVTPATPVAQAKPTPAPAPVAKPEPAVSKAEAFLATVAVVDADEDEQAMLDELPDDL